MRIAVTVALALALLGGWSDGAAAPRAPARVQIVSQEFTLTRSRQTLRAGPAIVELYNLGEDAHDLVIARVGASRPLARIRPLQSHNVADRELVLRPGKYVLWCSLADHRALGMQTRLTVVSSSR